MSESQDQEGQGQQTKPPGPPYPPQVWMLGGAPKKTVDIPVMSVFLALFIASAATHMTIFQINRKKGRKFLMSALLFGFSMARVVTSIMRITSISLPHDVPLAIAANIFTAAGVLLLFIINLIFTQRIMRASHPTFGWHAAFSNVFKALYVLIIAMIIMVITVTVQTFYTLNPNIRRIDRDIQLTGTTFFAFVSFLPIPIVLFGIILPRRHKLDKFGEGRWRTKIRILLLSTVLVSFGAIYRCTTTWMTPVPMTGPLPVYFHKAAFYIANFTVEIIVLFLYAILRVDRRFHIPNGARGYGSYAGGRLPSVSKGGESAPPTSDGEKFKQERSEALATPSGPRVYSEEETFDEDDWAEEKQTKIDLESCRMTDSPRLDTPIEGPELDMATPVAIPELDITTPVAIPELDMTTPVAKPALDMTFPVAKPEPPRSVHVADLETKEELPVEGI